VHGRDTLLLKGYGKANIELDVPMPANAVHEIGSVTKQFTAAAILQLRDEGLLSLDDDLTKYLPDYPTHGRSHPGATSARPHVGHQGASPRSPPSALSSTAAGRATRPSRSLPARRSTSRSARR
jgi:CubicO group peptidase (beta-lactamase class C family)